MENNIYKALIEAVDRYISCVKYPDLSIVCAILGIDPPEKEGVSDYD